MKSPTTPEQLYAAIMNLARQDGAKYPTLAESSDGRVTIIDTDDETKAWTVKLIDN